MILSNLCSFHVMQILQNATALPAYIYRETNNKARLNRKRHALSKQYWLKKKNLTQKHHQTQVKENHKPQRDTHQKSKTQHANQEFIPKPFPEKRAPVIIDSKARRKPNKPLPTDLPQRGSAKVVSPIENKPIKHQHPTKNESSIADKWLQAKPKQRVRKHQASNTQHTKITAKPQAKKHNANPPKSDNYQPKKFAWKPGRGAVEKIDKHSGEIFHLVEIM